ncbi:mevalonate kinase [Crossiella equi]|uniref:mevalonate kinase n=1 Tax=Crossiella equi TaxID=130796 RepID=A0ABS5APR1_9PSEU|nr:mevalonate kinase [Crossiella equi]MBP2478560.1 mevalonate kinase [Crossiella equi]
MEPTRVSSGSGRAHAKAILLGEHAVLYGSPALAIPVPALAVTAQATLFAEPGEPTFLKTGATGTTRYDCGGLRQVVTELTGGDERHRIEVTLRCEVPAGRGLGSSAACARAAVHALADLLGRELSAQEVYDLVQVAENVSHGRASGVDAMTTGATGPLLFQEGAAQEVGIGFDGLFVLADSGMTGSTKDAVTMVRERFEREPAARERFVGTVSGLVRSAVRDLADGDAAAVGTAMTRCHEELRELDLSTTVIDAMARAATSAGALGAKLSGGGLGGCLIALVDRQETAWDVSRALLEAGAVQTWSMPAGRGVRHDG